VKRGFSPWWALVILPVGMVLGWGLRGMTSFPERPASRAERLNEVAAVAAPTAPTPVREATPAPAGGTVATQDPSMTPTGEQKTEPGKEPVFSQWTSLQIAMVESDLNDKPILIDFNAAWCGPCQKMKEQVFDNPEFGRAVQSAVIPVSIVDRSKEDGRNPTEIQNLQRNFQVTGFPTLVVFYPATGKAEKTTGFATPEATVEWITTAAQSVR
jgi:thiol:disulfide interchange protein